MQNIELTMSFLADFAKTKRKALLAGRQKDAIVFPVSGTRKVSFAMPEIPDFISIRTGGAKKYLLNYTEKPIFMPFWGPENKSKDRVLLNIVGLRPAFAPREKMPGVSFVSPEEGPIDTIECDWGMSRISSKSKILIERELDIDHSIKSGALVVVSQELKLAKYQQAPQVLFCPSDSIINVSTHEKPDLDFPIFLQLISDLVYEQ
jgi:hypothetical protein